MSGPPVRPGPLEAEGAARRRVPALPRNTGLPLSGSTETPLRSPKRAWKTSMIAVSERPYTAADGARWAALALVFGAAMLNYMDRQALALLKPELEAQFGWD